MSPQPLAKRPVNLLLSDATVRAARRFTPNLSSTVENLLTNYILQQQQARLAEELASQQVTAVWNAFHAAESSAGHTSLADEFSTL